MSTPQHQTFVDLANRLIPKNGRTVQIVQEPTGSADANRPWEGPSDTETPTVLSSPKVLQTSWKRSDHETFNIEVSDIKFLLPASAAPDGFSSLMKIIDQGTKYEIVDFVLIQPGDTPILYIIQART